MNRPALHVHSKVYREYMISDRWRAKRRRKMAQVGAACEACGAAHPLSVHHRTYARLGHERLRDLRVVCDTDHDKIGALHDHGLALCAATDRVIPRRGWFERRVWRSGVRRAI